MDQEPRDPQITSITSMKTLTVTRNLWRILFCRKKYATWGEKLVVRGHSYLVVEEAVTAQGLLLG